MARDNLEHYKIKSNYLTPVEYPHHFCTSFYFNIYDYSMGFKSPPHYVTTVKGDIISGSITKDRSSTFVSSCSLEMVVSEDSAFALSTDYNWNDKFIAIFKKYDYLNDCYYRNPRFPDGISSYDVSDYYNSGEINMGYFKVDNLTYSYSAETRTLSLTGTDIISVLGEEHGGGLIDYETGQEEISSFIAEVGRDIYFYINQVLDRFSPIYFYDRFTYGTRIWLGETSELPYDLEFGSDATALSMLKKLEEIQNSLYMYVGNNFRFFISPVVASWVEPAMDTFTMGKQISNLVIEENTSIDLSNVFNYAIVYGREQEIYKNNKGEVISLSDVLRELDINNSDNITLEALKSKGISMEIFQPVDACALDYTLPIKDWDKLENNPFAVYKIGKRKRVFTDENCLTNEDCYNKGRWNIFQNTEFRETTTIKLVDNANPIFVTSNGYEILGVGTRIEYTSIVTGETNVYIINKVTHELGEGTWTLDLQPFRPLLPDMGYLHDGYGYPVKPYYDENGILKGDWALGHPSVNVEYGDGGVVNLTINNGEYTEWSLFKIFINGNLIGETCTEDKNLNKLFSYKFNRNGKYLLQVQAYSAQYPPSSKYTKSINITNAEQILTNELGKQLINENNAKLTI